MLAKARQVMEQAMGHTEVVAAMATVVETVAVAVIATATVVATEVTATTLLALRMTRSGWR